MKLENRLFFFNIQFKQNRRSWLYIHFYSYFKAVTPASRKEVGGKITVRKGEIAQQQKTDGDISLAFERNGNWMFFPFFPPSPLSNASVFPHLFFPITICSSPLLKFWHRSLSLNKDDDKNLKPIPIWKGTLCQIPLPSVHVSRGEEHGCADPANSPLLFSLRGGHGEPCFLQHHQEGPQDHEALSFCSVILLPQPFLCGRARYSGFDTGNVSNRGSAAADAHGIDCPCRIQLLHACTAAICPSGLSCTPKGLETCLSTIQRTSLIPKHIFLCLA